MRRNEPSQAWAAGWIDCSLLRLRPSDLRLLLPTDQPLSPARPDRPCYRIRERGAQLRKSLLTKSSCVTETTPCERKARPGREGR